MNGSKTLAVLAAIVLVAITPSGCNSDSSVTPPVDSAVCGAAARPCPFSCALPCASLVADLAESCVVTLQGTLDSTGQRCSFDDGTVVRFDSPLPETQAAVELMVVGVTIERQGAVCLSYKPLSTAELPGAPVSAEVQVGDKTYRQVVSYQALPSTDGGVDAAQDAAMADGAASDGAVVDSSAADAGATVDAGVMTDAGPARDSGPQPTRIELLCPADDKVYSATGNDLCADCRAEGCTTVPLVAVRLSGEPSSGITVELHAAGRTTPLLTCRRGTL